MEGIEYNNCPVDQYSLEFIYHKQSYRLGQIGQHFVDNKFKCIFLIVNV